MVNNFKMSETFSPTDTRLNAKNRERGLFIYCLNTEYFIVFQWSAIIDKYFSRQFYLIPVGKGNSALTNWKSSRFGAPGRMPSTPREIAIDR